MASDCRVGQRLLPPGLVVTIRRHAVGLAPCQAELALHGSVLVTFKAQRGVCHLKIRFQEGWLEEPATEQ